MRKPLLLFLMLLPLITNGQILGQDEQGFSSILLPTANLNLDGANNVVSFSLAQYVHRKKIEYSKNEALIIENVFNGIDYPFEPGQEPIFKNSINTFKNKNKQLISNSLLAGVELNGQSKNGLSIFLNEGLLSTKASFIGTIGYQIDKKVFDKRFIEYYAWDEYKIRTLMNQQDLLLDKTILHKIELLHLREIITQKKAKDLGEFEKGTREEQIRKIENDITYLNNLINPTFLQSLEAGLSKELRSIHKIKNLSRKAEQVFKKTDVDETKDLNELTIEDSNNLLKYREEVFKEIENLKTRGQSSNSSHSRLDIGIKLSDYLDKDAWEKVTKKFEKYYILLKRRTQNFKNYLTDNSELILSLVRELKELKSILSKLKEKEDRQEKYYGKELDFNRHIFYFRGGFNGTSFKYDLANEATTISERIVNRNFQGTRFEIGYTHQFKTRNFIGLNVSKDYTDNSSVLTSSKFSFKTVDNSVEPNLEITMEATALSGPYEKFDQYQISADYVRMLPLKYSNESDNIAEVYLNVIPYFRHRFYSNSTSLSPNTSVGVGCFVFNINKNSIGGGFFVQANDLFNNNRDTPLEFSKQINIGLVFKYAIDSFKPSSK